MNSKSAEILDFGQDILTENEIIAYGKLRATTIDIVSAIIETERKEKEIVFTVTEVGIDMEKIPKDEGGETTSVSQENRAQVTRIGLLLEFLNKLIDKILLEEKGLSRLILPYVRGITDAEHIIIKGGIKNADEVVQNVRARQLIIICY